MNRRDYGCGDNSCVFGSPGGMATNGGCRCFKEMARTPEGREARRRLTRGILELRQQAAQGRKVELPTARKTLEYMRRCAWADATYEQIDAALAELDAAEGRK